MKKQIKKLTIINDDSINIYNDSVDVYINLENDEFTYYFEFTTPQALSSYLERRKKSFVEARFPFLIVQQLTPDVIREIIEAFLMEDEDGFWFKLYSSNQYLTTDDLDFVIDREKKQIEADENNEKD